MASDWSFVGWFARQNGQRLGPLSAAQVRRMVLEGELPPDAPVWRKWASGNESRLVASRGALAVADPDAPEEA